ncbi:ABC transporter substrate-binding protein [Bradyrhizobium manausense]|uniref:ABC transporter substrate-binding protein n=1 Tax=Bradyrhizobium manausense TaxID=989370 RepID=UPI001BAD392A|nr:ABC transporter substrate-binding protein [Bradyrhizobium manausense]MBR0684311.1 ABC transporter substrate-binding protein [Bradyrhizobium manausense]
MTATFSRRTLLKRTAGLASLAAAPTLAVPAIAAAPSKITSFRSTSKSWLWAPEDFAIAKGFFRDENLEVAVVATERAPNIDALLSRSADIVLTPPDQAMRVQMKGQPVRLIAGMVNKYASHIVVRKSVLAERKVTLDSPVADRVAALKRLKLATTGAGGAPDSLFRYLFADNGINPETDVQLVPVRGGGAAMLAALKQGSIDGFGLSSPTSDLAVRDFGAAYLFEMSTRPPPFFEDFLYIAVATTDRIIKERAADLNAYYRGLARALKTIGDHPEVYSEWAAGFFSDLDTNLFKQAFANNSKIYMSDPRPTEVQFRRTVEFMNRQTMSGVDDRIPSTFAFKDWADQQFADAHAKRVVR